MVRFSEETFKTFLFGICKGTEYREIITCYLNMPVVAMSDLDKIETLLECSREIWMIKGMIEEKYERQIP